MNRADAPILLLGGAGYVGAQTAKVLKDAGRSVVIVDDLSSGHRESARFGELVVADIADAARMTTLCRDLGIVEAMHFAARIEVAESRVDPARYYENNVVKSKWLLDALLAGGVQSLVFSSSAAVYGDPQAPRISETHPCNPVNPYGRTKLVMEWMLEDYVRASNLKCIALRYFNAAGADPCGLTGEWHEPETHLLPLALQAASGRREKFRIFGNDYPTADGTCIRDFVHVVDVAQAHVAAVKYLATEQALPFSAINLGTGEGFSVRQVVRAVEEVTGRAVAVEYEPRRVGDPAVLVADPTRARNLLGWQPARSTLPVIVRDAWAWEQHLCTLAGSDA